MKCILGLSVTLLTFACFADTTNYEAKGNFDSNCDFIKITGLIVVGVAVQQSLYQQIILPMVFKNLI